MDNSPRWDAPYANVIPGNVPSTSARTTASSPIPASAPTDGEYDRYLWLLEEMKT